MQQMPQEIEVWYILPAIRKELAKSLVNDYHLTQKKTSQLLNITKAAVSQYKKEKRAKGVIFNKRIKKIIKTSAKKIMDNPSSLLNHVQNICNIIKNEMVLCEIHKSHEKNIPKDCCVCLK
jgi:hypothetical protein